MSNELTTTSTTPTASTDNPQFMFNLVTWIGKTGDKPNGTEWEQYMNLSPQLRHVAMDVIKGFGYPEIPSCQFLELFPSVRNDAPFAERFGVYVAFVRNLLAINIGIMGDDTPNNVNVVLSQLPPDVKDEYIKIVAADVFRGVLSRPPHFSWSLTPEDKEPTLAEKVKAYISLKKSVKRDEEDTITIRRSSYNALRDYVKKVQFHHKIYTLDNVLVVTQLDTKEDPTLDLLKNTFNAFSTLTAEADMVLLHIK